MAVTDISATVRSVRDGTRPAAAPAGFEDLYRRRATDALRYASVIVGPGEAEEVCQEAWLRVWQFWEGSTADRREAWALRIVRNCALERRRWRKRRPSVPLDEMDPSHPVMLEDLVLTRLEADHALDRLSELPRRQRETLFLREVAELSYGEIATMQGIPAGTVMSRLHAARRQMARHAPSRN